MFALSLTGCDHQADVEVCVIGLAATLARTPPFGIANLEPRFSFLNCASRLHGSGRAAAHRGGMAG
jgi:hypothetical protein